MPLNLQEIAKTDLAAIKAEFNLAYKRLDEHDSEWNEATGTQETFEISPSNRGEILATSFRKRALSYAHGAILAAHYLIPSDQPRHDAKNAIAVLCNAFDEKGEFTEETLYAFLSELSNAVKKYELTYGDIQAGEKVANLERQRPTTLVSTYGDSQIVETPLLSQMDHVEIASQYIFITPPVQTALRRDKQLIIPETAPQWFKDMGKGERVIQAYLIDHAQDGRLPALPPTLRGIPGMPNMSTHEGRFTFTWEDENNNKQTRRVINRVIRHGTLTPYEMMNHAEREAACRANGKVLAEFIYNRAVQQYENFWSQDVLDKQQQQGVARHISVADIGLVSPIHGEANVGVAARAQHQSVYYERSTPTSNRGFKKENMDAYFVGIQHVNANKPERNRLDPLPTNLGINGDRGAASKTFHSRAYRTQVNATLNKFKSVEQFVAAYRKVHPKSDPTPFRNPDAQHAFEMGSLAAKQLATMMVIFNPSSWSIFGSSSHASNLLTRAINAELFANCLYAMVIQGMGGTVSACCKSSKDRTGLFLLHLDAMHEFYAHFGKLPDFDAKPTDPDRFLFVEIMSDLYLRNTQQYMANLVTEGAGGLKVPGGASKVVHLNLDCWPADVVQAINKKADPRWTSGPGFFEAQCEIAELNKISKDLLKTSPTPSPPK